MSSNDNVHPPRVVALAGANSRTGQLLLPLLKARGWHTIALVRKMTTQSAAQVNADEVIADEVVANWMAATEGIDALRRSDVIVNFTGDYGGRNHAQQRAANYAPMERIVEAMRSGKARRAIFTSTVNASPKSSNLYFRYKGLAEELLLNSGKEAVVFRICTMLDTPENPGPIEQNFHTADGKAVQLPGSGKQRHRPIDRRDVAEALALAVEGGATGRFDLVGTEEMSADELIRVINGNPNVQISHTPPLLARLASRFVPDLSPAMMDVFLGDYTGDPSRFMAAYRLKPRSVREVWAAVP